MFDRWTGSGHARRWWFDGKPRRAQSEVVGVILLTAVVVLVVTVFGAFILGGVSESAGGSGPLVDAEVNVTVDSVSVLHVGGESVAVGELRVVLEGSSATERYDFDPANVTGDDDTFEPTERFEREHGLGAGTVDVMVVHDPSNAVLFHEQVETSA